MACMTDWHAYLIFIYTLSEYNNCIVQAKYIYCSASLRQCNESAHLLRRVIRYFFKLSGTSSRSIDPNIMGKF